MYQDRFQPDMPFRRLQKKPRPPFNQVLLPVAAAGSTALLIAALPDLIGADGVIDHAKCVIMGVFGGFVSYAVNLYALEKGAPQAAIGSLLAGLTSTASVLAVGAGLGMASYSGLVIEKTDRLRLQEYAAAQDTWLEERVSASRGGASALPLLQATIADLGAKAECEDTSSCVSGRGSGKGDAWRTLSGAHGRGSALLEELSATIEQRQSALTSLGALQSSLQGTLGDSSLSGSDRRLQAQELVRRSASVLSDIEGANPDALIDGFAEELLRSGAGTPQDRLLSSHGAGLASALHGRRPERSNPPEFPAPSGVADTLRFIPHFLPIALLVAVIELILPISLWVYTLVALRARLEAEENEEARPAKRGRPAKPTPKPSAKSSAKTSV